MSIKVIIRLFCLLVLIGTMILGPTTIAQAESVVIRNDYSELLDYTRYVPCLNNGAGDTIHITGVMKYHFHFVTDPVTSRYDHIVITSNFENASAVSETTGMKYRVSSSAQDREKFNGFPILLNFNYKMHIVGPGKDNIFRHHFSSLFQIDENMEWPGKIVHVRDTVNCDADPWP